MIKKFFVNFEYFIQRLYRAVFKRNEFSWFYQLFKLRILSKNYKNFYYNQSLIEKNLNKNEFYKDVVGGSWEEIGNLQFQYLIQENLKPHHKLFDIGCGSLRGGCKFIKYLDINNYYGIDIYEKLIDLGYKKEIKEKNLEYKINRKNLVSNENFNFDKVNTIFDYALSISLFTHLPLTDLDLCLQNLKKLFKPDAKYYSTFFLANDRKRCTNTDPYYHYFDDILAIAVKNGYVTTLKQNFKHPRGQQMICFELSN